MSKQNSTISAFYLLYHQHKNIYYSLEISLNVCIIITITHPERILIVYILQHN